VYAAAFSPDGRRALSRRTNAGAGAYVSPLVYAPDTKACADGEAFNTAGDLYEAHAGQYPPC
jgi:hypothetical protein